MAASYLRPDPKNPTVYLPHLFIIDKEGMIRADFGHNDADAFDGPKIFQEVDRLLSGKSAAPPKSEKGGR